MADLEKLAVFVRVVESQSFSEAGRRLHMPKSTVSRQVAELEQTLNVTLLERSTRRLRLTDVGREIFEKARLGVELAKAVDDIADAHHSVVSGPLRLSAPPSISETLLAPLTSTFQEANPQVHVQILISGRFVDMVAEGVDASFIVGPLTQSDLVARAVLQYRHRVVASPEYLARRRPLERPEDLREHPLYAFSFWKPDTTWHFRRGREAIDLVFRPHLSINDYLGIVPALVEGRGIGELPPLIRPDLLHDGRLVEVLPQWHLPTFDLKIVRLGSRYASRAAQAFIDFVCRRAPELFPNLPT